MYGIMAKHKPIILLFIILIRIPSDSTTRTEKGVNFNTTAMSNDSFHSQHLKIQSFINEGYTLNNASIHNTVISLENISVFLSNAMVTGCKILANGTMNYSVFFNNCVFDDSEIVIDSASNVTIMYSHFIMYNVKQEEEPNHVVQIYNTGSLLMTDTHFGNQSKHNQKDKINSNIIGYTNRGLKVENVSIAELKNCYFTGINAEKTSGSAIRLQNTEISMISCKLYLNTAENGVIFGINSVNITSINSSYISNHAANSGAVFYLTDSCSLTNDGSVFLNNSAKKHAGVLYATHNVTIDNIRCLFQYNTAETGNAGAIYGQYKIEVFNNETRFISNRGEYGGAIYIRDHVMYLNSDSTFQKNLASLHGGAIHCQNDVKVINTQTRFISNKGRLGGAICMRDWGTITNTDSIFQDNSAYIDGGAIRARFDVGVMNNATRFINNTAYSSGGAFYIKTRGKCENTACLFIKNHAGFGSVMGLWYGVNCTIIDCNFTQNTAYSQGGAVASYGSYDYTNFLFSIRSIFDGNSAQSIAGVFRLTGPNIFSSENNVYVRNSAATGSVLAAESRSTNVVMSGDIIRSNDGNAATIYIGDITNIHISDTEFTNNYQQLPTVYVANSVNSFTCFRCIFRQNMAEVGGVISISYANQVVLGNLKVQNNDVTIGSMIKITKSTNTTVLSSLFKDNLCANLPCAISIQKTDNTEIEHLSLVSHMPKIHRVSQSKSKQQALDIDAKHIALKNVDFTGVPGYVYKGVSGEHLFFKNVSYECPESHIHNTKVMNSNIDFLQLSPLYLENATTLALRCMQCDDDSYRFGVPFLTFMDISDLSNQYADGICYKCPPGGVCDGLSVVALPNYWGFLYQDKMNFVFCQPGFCCEAGTCASYNGCVEGREGKACTSCIHFYQLGIGNDICIPSNKCVESWLYPTIFLTAILYLGFLVLKVELFNFLLLAYFKFRNWCKKRDSRKESPHFMMVTNNTIRTIFQNGNQPDFNTDRGGSTSDANHEDSWKIPFDHVEIFHILVFHFQDTRLFKIILPGMPNSSIQLDHYRDAVLALFRFDTLVMGRGACFPAGWTLLNKLLVKTSIIPIMILVLLSCMLIIKLVRLREDYENRLMSSACRVFLLVVLFSSQLLSNYALNFITCETFGSEDYLSIDTTVKCYQLWQFFVFCYIGLFIIPFWLTLFLGPGLLASGKVSITAFLFGLLFPAPFAFYSIRLVWKERKKDSSASCHDLPSTAVLSEVWDSFTPFPTSRYLCWVGIVEIRRLFLVFCASLIDSSVNKLLCMITVVAIAYSTHVRFRPYADPVANTCANISLAAQVMVGIVNFSWATFQYSGSEFGNGDAKMIGQNLLTYETILIQLFPLGAVIFCIGYFLFVNCFRTCRRI